MHEELLPVPDSSERAKRLGGFVLGLRSESGEPLATVSLPDEA